jgi:hypothetical protein
MTIEKWITLKPTEIKEEDFIDKEKKELKQRVFDLEKAVGCLVCHIIIATGSDGMNYAKELGKAIETNQPLKMNFWMENEILQFKVTIKE